MGSDPITEMLQTTSCQSLCQFELSKGKLHKKHNFSMRSNPLRIVYSVQIYLNYETLFTDARFFSIISRNKVVMGSDPITERKQWQGKREYGIPARYIT